MENLGSDIEDERKHRVLAPCWADKAALLDAVAAFVAAEPEHFVTLDQPPHTDGFDAELAAAAHLPITTRPLHRRIYWATSALAGYQEDEDTTAEVRIERRAGEDKWCQTVKLGARRTDDKTLSRREIERDIDDFGIDLGLLPDDARRIANTILDGKPLKPVICLQGQGVPLLYYPDGRREVMFEIKFDKGKGFAFDGRCCDVVEIEIELKSRHPSVAAEEIESLFDKSDVLIYAAFPGRLERRTESKPAKLFRHLCDWQARDRATFEAAFEALPSDRWDDIAAS